MRTALLVIDVQSYFLERSPADLPSRIVEHIRKSSYDCVAFTIFDNPVGSNWERSLGWTNCRDSRDKELAAEFNSLALKENSFIKSSYSALELPALRRFLQSQDIQNVELCGIDVDACVLATAFQAFDQGYGVRVLLDLCHSRAGMQNHAKDIINRNLQSKN